MLNIMAMENDERLCKHDTVNLTEGVENSTEWADIFIKDNIWSLLLENLKKNNYE